MECAICGSYREDSIHEAWGECGCGAPAEHHTFVLFSTTFRVAVAARDILRNIPHNPVASVCAIAIADAINRALRLHTGDGWPRIDFTILTEDEATIIRAAILMAAPN